MFCVSVGGNKPASWTRINIQLQTEINMTINRNRTLSKVVPSKTAPEVEFNNQIHLKLFN